MVIHLDAELEAALAEQAARNGQTAEALAICALRERFITVDSLKPQDEWERGLLAAARECGVSLSNEALSSEALYDL
ncbi:MAG TPA: hypothetical protein VFW87_24675 [Pirellulales bacterium]|nr:hypothetical protein [Pirellulales bacterium]